MNVITKLLTRNIISKVLTGNIFKLESIHKKQSNDFSESFKCEQQAVSNTTTAKM